MQIILEKRFLEKIKEKSILKSEEWVKEMENIEKMDSKQIKINAELYWRCWNHEWDKAAECIKNGGKNDFVDDDGYTAAHWSAQYGNDEITELILKNEKNQIQRRDNNWKTPLTRAFQFGRNQVAEKILDIGAAHPIAELLLSSENLKTGLDIFEKKNLLAKNNIQNDLEYLKDAKFTDEPGFKNNIGNFIGFCRDDFKIDMNPILQKIFNEKYIKDEDLLWHDGKNFITSLIWKEGQKEDCYLIVDVRRTKIIYRKQNSPDVEIKNDDLKYFLLSKLTACEFIKLSNIVDVGGESVILKDEVDPNTKVAKIVKMDISTVENNELGLVDEEKTYNKDKPNELTANDMNHPNIIKYSKSLFQYVHGHLFHITG